MKQGLLYYQLGQSQSHQGQQLISQAAAAAAVAEENMSNLTTASGEASGNSSGNPNHKQTPPAKKKRNQPGNPDPDAEVVALSPKTLMATNRFVCEICNKGFQRDQNLQLHRRGHNLPWKLKQRSSKEVRKRVYICPEVGCVHHNPDRALGDLTGIKKHFSRKHGEKKWKCERCNKRYAVLSDWKAHSKTCGTREYRCDCGTLFSRRDSFITHRAFCDALTEESARATIPITNHQLPVGPAHSSSSSHLHQQPFKKKSPEAPEPPPPSSFLPHRPELPPWLTFTPAASAPPPPPSIVEDEEYYSQAQEYLGPQDDVYSPSNPSHHHHKQQHDLLPYGFTPPAHMSATALLQKAAQMGTMPAMPSSPPSSGMVGVLHRGHVPADGSSRASCVNNMSSSELMIATPGFVHNTLSPFEYSKAAAAASSSFGGPLLRGPAALALAGAGAGVSQSSALLYGGVGGSRIGDDLTRDFLGLRALSRRDIMSMAGLGGCMNNNTGTSNGHLY